MSSTLTTTPGNSPAPAQPATGSRLAALDGLRGLALLGMLAWHAELEWVKGGFARMTIFFVLAGFLAGTSLRRAYDRGDPRAFRTFWGRRARRLLPVTLLGVAWAIAVTAMVGGSHARETVVGDALATLGSVANWRFLADDRPYGAMVETGTAFQHYWSLSLEEQAFLLLPGILALLAFVSRGNDRTRLALLGAMAVGCAAIPAVIPHSPDAAYYGTHVRLGEFLAGVLLAEIVARRPLEHLDVPVQRALGVAGAAGLAILLATMAFVDRDQDWLYQGGLGLYAIPTVAVIAAILLAAPVVSAALSLVPLVALGRWALSVYVLHWPLYQLLDDGRIGLSGTSLALVQIVVSVIVGGLCYVWIEQPLIRAFRVGGGAKRVPVATGHAAPRPFDAAEVATAMVQTHPADDPVPDQGEHRHPREPLAAQLRTSVSRRPGWALLAAALVLSAAALAVPQRTPLIDFEQMESQVRSGDEPDAQDRQQLAELREDAARELRGPPMTPEEAIEALERSGSAVMPVFRDPHERGVGSFGGSAALTFGAGTYAWADTDPVAVPAIGWAGLGCGLITSGERVARDAAMVGAGAGFERPPQNCLLWDLLWPATTIQHQIDVAVIFASTWDLDDWRFEGDDQLRSPGDPVFDEMLETQLLRAVDLLERSGADEVVLVNPPPFPDAFTGDDGVEYRRRADVYEQTMDRVAEQRSEVVRTIDMRSWLAALDDADRRSLLPDGVHATPGTAEQLWIRFLGPQVAETTTTLDPS